MEIVQLPEWFAPMALGFFHLISSVTPANPYAIFLSRSLILPFYFLLIFFIGEFQIYEGVFHRTLDSGLWTLSRVIGGGHGTCYSPFSFSKHIWFTLLIYSRLSQLQLDMALISTTRCYQTHQSVAQVLIIKHKCIRVVVVRLWSSCMLVLITFF